MANSQNPERGGMGPRREEQPSHGSTLGALQERAQGLASSVAEGAQDVWDSTRGAVSTMTDTAGDVWGDATRFMKRYPVATFFAGFALGALMAGAFSALPGRGSHMIRGMERAG